MRIIINSRIPKVNEYNDLRRLVEWPTLDEEVVREGLKNSLFSVVAEDQETGLVVGMGRVIGDKAIYLHIQDVIVHPEFQRQGIGRIIMQELLAFATSIGGKNTNIGLMCSKGREDFYKEFGFIERPNAKFGAGMIKVKL